MTDKKLKESQENGCRQDNACDRLGICVYDEDKEENHITYQFSEEGELKEVPEGNEDNFTYWINFRSDENMFPTAITREEARRYCNPTTPLDEIPEEVRPAIRLGYDGNRTGRFLDLEKVEIVDKNLEYVMINCEEE